MREIETGIDERADAGKKEDEIQDEIEPRLIARVHRPIQEVTADMAVLGERIGACHHEQRAIHHVVGIEYPGGGRIQDVALEYFDAHHACQQKNDPGEQLSAPRVYVVDE